MATMNVWVIYTTYEKVHFSNFTDEIVLPEGITDDKGNTVQISRTPFLAGFEFCSQKITLCNVHIYFGGMRDRLEREYSEIKAVTSLLSNQLERNRLWSDKLILLGTFQTTSEVSQGIKILKEHGFNIPEYIRGLGTNARLSKPYDQIALKFSDSTKCINAYKRWCF